MALVYKSVAEHRDYLYQIVRLKLFFLQHWCAAHPEENFRQALRKRVDIYRKTDANTGWLNPTSLEWEGPAWQKLETGLEAVYRKYHHEAAAFEEYGFAVLQSSIDARVERDYLDRSGLEGYQCGSLRHELQLFPERKDTIVFHIANALCPCSIFDDPLYLPDCFMALMRRVEILYGAKNIFTHTWLNSHPAWLALFPPEWQQSLDAPFRDVQWHYGFWGQFITARGTFNAKAGQQLRTTGELPYYPRAGQCSIAAMRHHLEKNFYDRKN